VWYEGVAFNSTYHGSNSGEDKAILFYILSSRITQRSLYSQACLTYLTRSLSYIKYLLHTSIAPTPPKHNYPSPIIISTPPPHPYFKSTNPPPRALKKPNPRSKIPPLLRLLRRNPRPRIRHTPLRMRHQRQHPPIHRPHPRNPTRTSIRICRIYLRRPKIIIHITDRNQILRQQGVRSCRLGRCGAEVSAAFAVAEGDGHGGSVHAVEEDGGGGGGVEDLDFAVSRFVLLAGVFAETGPG